LEEYPLRKKNVCPFLALALLLLSCAGMEKIIQPPSVRIETVKLASVDFEKLGLDIVFQVNNPNPFGVSLSGFDYNFAIENKQLLSGRDTRGLALAGQKVSELHFPITVKFVDVYQLVNEKKDLDTLAYSFSGTIIPAGLLAAFKIPFSKSGHLPNVRLPQLSLKNVKIQKLSLSGVELKLLIGLKNPNIFGFNVGKLDYKLDLAGKPFASGITGKLLDIPAKGDGVVELPISINSVGVLGSLYSALSGQSIAASLQGTAELNTPHGTVPLPFNTQSNLRILR
jgi:LEA14-like dessication related protein